AREQVRGLVATLGSQLADGRPFLLGRAFSLADAACFHPLWFLRVAPSASTLLAPFPRVRDWIERMDALGAGNVQPLAPADRLAAAAAAAALAGVAEPGEPNGLSAGERVAVVPDDYGFDPVAGTVAAASANEIAIRRTADGLGEVVVHFPRVGFRVLRDAS